MGLIIFKAIIVTGWQKKKLKKARKKAIFIFCKHLEIPHYRYKQNKKFVSKLIPSIINSYYTFLIAPDCSKQGYPTEQMCDNARAEFLLWLKKHKSDIQFTEVKFKDELEG